MKKAVIYARYSSDNQTEQSIEGQLRVCNEYATREGYTIIDNYIDRAMTGTNDNRPAFQQMLLDSGKKGFEYVLVYKFDRFARSRHDSAVNKAILKKNGVKVISATEFITDSPEGIILEGMLESFAEYYSAELSQKVKRGRKESRIKGYFVGGYVPYGYYVKDKKVYVNEQQAEIVKQCYNDYLSGMKLKDIAAKLTNQGVKTNFNNNFSINQVSRMLRNTFYVGKVYADDTVYTNIYPRIIDDEIFEKVNKTLQVSKRTGAQKKAVVPYLLSGKLVCGECKALMTGDCGTGRNHVHFYYNCVNRKKTHTCHKKPVEKYYIENYIVEATKNFLKNCKQLEQISSNIAILFNKSIQEDFALNSLNSQLKDVNRKLNNMANAIANGIFSRTTNEKLNSLEKQKEEIEIKIAEHSIKKIQPVSADTIYNYFLSFKDIDITDTKACQTMINMFVNKVILYDNGEVFIVYNTSEDDTQLLKLDTFEDYENLEKDIKKKQSNHSGSDCSQLVGTVGLEPTLVRTRPLNVRVCQFRHIPIY